MIEANIQRSTYYGSGTVLTTLHVLAQSSQKYYGIHYIIISILSPENSATERLKKNLFRNTQIVHGRAGTQTWSKAIDYNSMPR